MNWTINYEMILPKALVTPGWPRRRAGFLFREARTGGWVRLNAFVLGCRSTFVRHGSVPARVCA